jgi:hypothetical protein
VNAVRIGVSALGVLACLLTAAPASAAALGPGSPHVMEASRFVGFTPTQLAWINGLVDRAPRPARDALARVAPYISFRRGSSKEISDGDHVSTFVGTDTLRFLVSLGLRTRAARDALAAHMLMHELGHTVDNALVSEELRGSFGVLFSKSPVWQSCFQQPLGSSQRCVPGTEIFAEQFAFYGARDRQPRTLYVLPPLYGFRAFGALLGGATGGADTLLELQLQDEARSSSRKRWPRVRPPLPRGGSAPAFADTGGRVVDEGPAVPGSVRRALLASCFIAALALIPSRVAVKAGSGDRVHPVVVPPVAHRAEARGRGVHLGGRRPRRSSVFAAERRELAVGVRADRRGVVIEPTRDPERQQRDREQQQQTTLARGAAEPRCADHGSRRQIRPGIWATSSAATVMMAAAMVSSICTVRPTARSLAALGVHAPASAATRRRWRRARTRTGQSSATFSTTLRP